MALTAAADPNLPASPAWFAGLLPHGVVIAELAGAGDPGLLLPGERALLGTAGPARVREFAAGRLCARRAMTFFGHGDVPLGVQSDRRPCWPASLTGSITHVGDYAAAAVGERRHYRAIGIDAERVGAVTVDLWRHVFRPAETDWLEGLPHTVQDRAGTLLFSAKEAYFKCQYEVTAQWLDFHDVVVDFFGPHLGTNGFVVRPVHGREPSDDGAGAIVRYAFRDDLVLTATALPAH